ncbi:hypothetical protein GT347_23435 [Xylophilus rhododendri]|uniref:Uncharacterized protein n=1 Tax=Xylophilus rhododendri TaxID=2697032 RepID=A0A857J9T9_9BURK|nr:hypothetical protein [Xylophilus rhododendri]QHJ00677.1 hypothetical protein GT347_23435 [Xylophilus rhododendri]
MVADLLALQGKPSATDTVAGLYCPGHPSLEAYGPAAAAERLKHAMAGADADALATLVLQIGTLPNGGNLGGWRYQPGCWQVFWSAAQELLQARALNTRQACALIDAALRASAHRPAEGWPGTSWPWHAVRQLEGALRFACQCLSQQTPLEDPTLQALVSAAGQAALQTPALQHETARLLGLLSAARTNYQDTSALRLPPFVLQLLENVAPQHRPAVRFHCWLMQVLTHQRESRTLRRPHQHEHAAWVDRVVQAAPAYRGLMVENLGYLMLLLDAHPDQVGRLVAAIEQTPGRCLGRSLHHLSQMIMPSTATTQLIRKATRCLPPLAAASVVKWTSRLSHASCDADAAATACLEIMRAAPPGSADYGNSRQHLVTAAQCLLLGHTSQAQRMLAAIGREAAACVSTDGGCVLAQIAVPSLRDRAPVQWRLVEGLCRRMEARTLPDRDIQRCLLHMSPLLEQPRGAEFYLRSVAPLLRRVAPDDGHLAALLGTWAGRTRQWRGQDRGTGSHHCAEHIDTVLALSRELLRPGPRLHVLESLDVDFELAEWFPACHRALCSALEETTSALQSAGPTTAAEPAGPGPRGPVLVLDGVDLSRL